METGEIAWEWFEGVPIQNSVAVTLTQDHDETQLVLSETWNVDKGVLTGPEYKPHLDADGFITPHWIKEHLGQGR